MLDAIADFWKPVKRFQAQMRLKPEELQIGSMIVFGFLPQPMLSGRRMTVTAINTYKFGSDILTSFVLSQENDTGASMIIAETGGEQYLAISRRISRADREKLFDMRDLDAVINNDQVNDLRSKEVHGDYKGWIASHYKRELQRVRGQFYKGDHRKGLMTNESALDFAYTLMVSDNNEHALEIEKYEDGRVEIYATVYRRMSDVGEVSHPAEAEKAKTDVRLVSNGHVPVLNVASKPEPKLESALQEASSPVAVQTEEEIKPLPRVEEQQAEAMVEKESVQPPSEEITTEAVQDVSEVATPSDEETPVEKKPDVQEDVVSSPMTLPEFEKEDVAPKREEIKDEPEVNTAPAEKNIPHNHDEQVASEEETPPVIAATLRSASNEPTSHAPITIKSTNQPYTKQEIKAVNNEPSNFVNESIDCELQVANKIIDEAIRNEMRINDVVRRVIGLPVSQQEAVQIPVTLTDQDYALLAIRYGISSNDREAIKKRIIEDLGDFSGNKKAA